MDFGNRPKPFENVKLGDSIVMSVKDYRGVRYNTGSVVQVTKTRFKVKFESSDKFMVYTKDGYEFPYNRQHYNTVRTSIYMPTAEDLVKVTNNIRNRKLVSDIKENVATLAKMLNNQDDVGDLDTLKLQRINSAISEVLALDTSDALDVESHSEEEEENTTDEAQQ